MIRTELRKLEAALLNLWVDAISVQPTFAEHLRAAARFTHNAVMAIDAGGGAHVLVAHTPDGEQDDVVIDLTTTENR